MWKEYLYTHILFTVNTDNKCTTFLVFCEKIWAHFISGEETDPDTLLSFLGQNWGEV